MNPHPRLGAASVAVPLSPAQAGMWYGHHLDPTGRRHTVAECLEIRGPLDIKALLAAFRLMVAETDAYRVVSVGGVAGVDQLVSDDPDVFPLHVRDLTPTAEPELAAAAAMRADLAAPIDLGSGPLTHSTLFKVGTDRFRWYLRGHHLTCDAYGNRLTCRRVAEVYSATTSGRPVPPRTFGTLGDLLAEDGAYRASADWTADREYWRRQLDGCPPPVRLGAVEQAPRPEVVRSTTQVATSTAARLRGTAAATRTPWPVWMVAATAAYLHRTTGQRDIVLGMLVSGRRTRLARHTPGMTANVLPVRIRIEPGRPLAQMVPPVWAAMSEALKHQRYRYEDMRRDLGLSAADPGILGPLINVLTYDTPLDFGALRSTVHNLAVGPTDDLSIIVYDRDDRLRVGLDGNAGWYGQGDLLNHRDGLLTFLDMALRDPAGPLSKPAAHDPADVR
ncbi:condensation domain-containing protein [Actinoplanes sp. NPDC051346]|uniref:condensation domain-containing protein n=1 Tax=Actinoplanes sp. NPDC051346 TaxID=3155048 RepID=UPI00342214F3